MEKSQKAELKATIKRLNEELFKHLNECIMPKSAQGSKTTKSTFNPAFLVDSKGNSLNIEEKHENPQPIDYARVTAASIKRLTRPTIPDQRRTNSSTDSS